MKSSALWLQHVRGGTQESVDFEKRRARAEDGDRAASDFVAVEGKENEVSAL